MKPVIVILSILIIIIIIGYSTLTYLEVKSEILDNKLSQIESFINNENWDEALNTLKDFKKYWEKSSGVYSALIDHFEIDNIEVELSKLKPFIDARDKVQALAKLSALKLLIKHIPSKEAVNLRNIL